jgi:hypothetical protein
MVRQLAAEHPLHQAFVKRVVMASTSASAKFPAASATDP